MFLQDVQYGDIDHFDANKDFTYDKENFAGLPEYFQELRDMGMKTIIILVGNMDSNSSNNNHKDYKIIDSAPTMLPDTNHTQHLPSRIQHCLPSMKHTNHFTTGRDLDVFIKWPAGANPQFERFNNDYMHGYVSVYYEGSGFDKKLHSFQCRVCDLNKCTSLGLSGLARRGSCISRLLPECNSDLVERLDCKVVRGWCSI